MPKFNGDCGDSDDNGDWMTVVTVVSGDSGTIVICSSDSCDSSEW